MTLNSMLDKNIKISCLPALAHQYTASIPSSSFLHLIPLHDAAPPPLLFSINGMKVAMAGIQDHRARDHTDGER